MFVQNSRKTLPARLSLVSLVCVAIGSPAVAQSSDATTRANRMAYEASIKCFEANGVARRDAVRLGKKALASDFNSKAKASFDAALKLGDALGYSGSDIQQDLDAALAQEVPKLVQDPAYFRKVTATCKALELM